VRTAANAGAGKPVIFALWHGRLLPLGFVHRGQGIVCLASRSGDGEYITRILQHWGFDVVRGSSSSGGDTAFRELIRRPRPAGPSRSRLTDRAVRASDSSRACCSSRS
jgi:lysophospholipid acyltransferase (LPLAT)-like uncharacterized protein